MYKVYYSNVKGIVLKCLADDTNATILESVPTIFQYDGYHQVRFVYMGKQLIVSEGYSPYEYDKDGKIKFYEFDEYIKLDQDSVHPVLSEKNPPYETIEEYNKLTNNLLECEQFDDLETARLFYELV